MSGTWSRKRRGNTSARYLQHSASSVSVPPTSRSGGYGTVSGAHFKDPLGCATIPMPLFMQQQQLLLSRSTERMFEEAEASGVLLLAGRKLKDFPDNFFSKYDMSDLVAADLSSNRLGEMPTGLCEMRSLESLRMRGNALKRVPSNIGMLSELTFIDLSNNRLVQLPLSLFELPLEVLLIAGNRLESIPREIRQLSSTLTELDVSHNLLRAIPADIALLKALRVLILRKNMLDQFPSELCRLSLHTLDLSSNCYTHLPLHLRKMKTLIDLNIDENPLQSPPANVVAKGREHIFKWMRAAASGCDNGTPQAAGVVRAHHHSTDTPHCGGALQVTRTPTTGSGDSVDAICVPRKTSAPCDRRQRATRFNTVGGSDSGYASTADEHRLSRELATSSGLDDINEYATLSSPSPDEGIHVVDRTEKSENSLSSKKERPLSKSSNEVDDSLISLMDVYDRTMTPVREPLKAVPLAVPEDTTTPSKVAPTVAAAKSSPLVKSAAPKLSSTPKRPTAPAPAPPPPNIAPEQTKLVAPGVEIGRISPLDVSNNNAVLITDVLTTDTKKTSTTASAHVIPTTNRVSSKPISKVAPIVNTGNMRGAVNAAATGVSINNNNKPVTAVPPKSVLKPNAAATASKQPLSLSSALASRSSSSISSRSSTMTTSVTGVRSPRPVATTSNGQEKSAAGNKSRLPLHSVRPSVSSGVSLAAAAKAYSNSATTRASSELRTTSATHGNIAKSPNTSTARKPLVRASTTEVASPHSTGGGAATEVENMRRVFTDRLGVTLPATKDGVSSQLSDGAHLCSLVNALRPRTIPSIQSPTDENPLPAVRAKRNVDSFVTSCRRLGIPESSICLPSDIMAKRNLVSIARTVTVLNKMFPGVKSVSPPTSAPRGTAPLAPRIEHDPELVTHV